MASHNPFHPPAGSARRKLAARPWIALAAGALAATGSEPLHWWPLALVGIAALIALAGATRRPGRAFLFGWLWGVAHFTVGNNWIATAFTYQAQMPAWLGWIAVVLLSLYLAIYPALAALGAWLLRRFAGGRVAGVTPGFVLAFAGCWIVSEWLRGWVFTGYPWNPLAAVALGDFAHPGLATVARFIGTYALSGVVAGFAGMWALVLVRQLGDRSGGVAGRVRLALLVALPAAVWLGAGLAPREQARPGPVPYVLVQPLIPQPELDRPELYPSHFARLARLTGSGDTRPRLVLWPESGVPDYLRPGYPQIVYSETTFGADPALARQRIARTIGPRSLLLTGAVDLSLREDDLGGRRIVGARNSVTAVDGHGRIVGHYFKAHLVPYGEYLPMRGLLEPLGLSRLVAGSLDFLPGPGPRTIDLGPLGRAGVQICYEIVFSGHVIDRDHRPDYLFNPSNDGWFGAWGPPQHLAQARLRAIEEGIPVLRSTTTGISAVIGPDGRVLASVGRNQAGRISGQIPQADPPTLFARSGNIVALLLAAMLLAVSAVVTRRRGR